MPPVSFRTDTSCFFQDHSQGVFLVHVDHPVGAGFCALGEPGGPGADEVNSLCAEDLGHLRRDEPQRPGPDDGHVLSRHISAHRFESVKNTP
jgi:hypothetical protein